MWMEDEKMTALVNEWNRPPLAVLNDPSRRAVFLQMEAEGANAYLAQVGGDS